MSDTEAARQAFIQEQESLKGNVFLAARRKRIAAWVKDNPEIRVLIQSNGNTEFL